MLQSTFQLFQKVFENESSDNIFFLMGSFRAITYLFFIVDVVLKR